MLRSLKDNDSGNVIPLVMFILVIFCCGALYSLFFLEVAFPLLGSYIPSGDAKTFVMMAMYAIPLFVLLVSLFALLLSGLKKQIVYGGN